MKIILKLISAALSTAFGYATILLIFHVVQRFGSFDQATDTQAVTAYFTNAIFAWITGIIVMIGYFIIPNALKYICLIAPVLAVIIHGLKFTFLSS